MKIKKKVMQSSEPIVDFDFFKSNGATPIDTTDIGTSDQVEGLQINSPVRGWELEDLLQSLQEMTPYCGVLQWGPQGFYVQVQIESNNSSHSGNGVKLDWTPLTGIYTSPYSAVKAALESPHGKNLPQPPSEGAQGQQEATEAVSETVVDYTQEDGTEVHTFLPEKEEPEKVKYVIQKPSELVEVLGDHETGISFSAVLTSDRPETERVRLLLIGVSKKLLYGELVETENITSDSKVVFDFVTGKSQDNEMFIESSDLTLVQRLVNDFVERSKESAVKELESVEPELNTYGEWEELLRDYVNKKVTAKRKFPSERNGTEVSGTYLGFNNLAKEFIVKREGTSKHIAVLPDTIVKEVTEVQ